jgi:16S rRNA pseudouridine516 synthase
MFYVKINKIVFLRQGGSFVRIDKYICECTSASRKEVSLLARRGNVSVNGETVKDVSKHINENSDRVVFCGEELSYRRFVYVMLNKPEGYISATEDSRFPVVTELLPEELRKKELFPVGRLDKDTVGLMILTNNGKLAHALLSPKRHCEKEYYFESKLPLADGAERLFSEGITLADGYECKSAKLTLNEERTGGIITLTEGKYHQIKRMLGALDNRVTFLERVSFAKIRLDRNLGRGEYRYLTEEEISLLEAYN